MERNRTRSSRLNSVGHVIVKSLVMEVESFVIVNFGALKTVVPMPSLLDATVTLVDRVADSQCETFLRLYRE
jgi:hypothetical protein